MHVYMLQYVSFRFNQIDNYEQKTREKKNGQMQSVLSRREYHKTYKKP